MRGVSLAVLLLLAISLWRDELECWLAELRVAFWRGWHRERDRHR